MKPQTLQRSKEILAIWDVLEIIGSRILDACDEAEREVEYGEMEPDETIVECTQCQATSNHCSNAGDICLQCKLGVMQLRNLVYPENAAPELDAASAELFKLWNDIAEVDPAALDEAHRLRALRDIANQ